MHKRKQKMEKNRKIRLLKWYHQRSNKLDDYIEKLSTEMVKKYDTIVFEKNYSKIKIFDWWRAKHGVSTHKIHN